MAAPVTYATCETSDYVGTGGGGTVRRETWKVFSSELVNGTASVESAISAAINGIAISEFGFFGVWLKATSVAGAPNVTVTFEQSYDDTAGNYASPATGGIVVATSVSEAAQVFLIAPVPLPRIRFKVQGITGNQTDTLVTLYFFQQG